jgi:hypothetical protein
LERGRLVERVSLWLSRVIVDRAVDCLEVVKRGETGWPSFSSAGRSASRNLWKYSTAVTFITVAPTRTFRQSLPIPRLVLSRAAHARNLRRRPDRQPNLADRPPPRTSPILSAASKPQGTARYRFDR